VSAAAPALFSVDRSGYGQAVASNADGGTNSAANPAMAGTILALYATGTGGGAVSATVGSGTAEVRFVGNAPGDLPGVVEIDVVVPAGTVGAAVPVAISVAGKQSQPGVTVAVQAAQPLGRRAQSGRQ
jgi:uncharacterized protein (TIGR03437 family)